jgi:hypothetical protein
VGKLPVYLVPTGITDSLSAPITLESISAKVDTNLGDTPGTVKTTLETAVDFVMHLEDRENAAFGLLPDPIASWKPSRVLKTTVPEPSSRFVDPNRYPHWVGSGHD